MQQFDWTVVEIIWDSGIFVLKCFVTVLGRSFHEDLAGQLWNLSENTAWECCEEWRFVCYRWSCRREAVLKFFCNGPWLFTRAGRPPRTVGWKTTRTSLNGATRRPSIIPSINSVWARNVVLPRPKKEIFWPKTSNGLSWSSSNPLPKRYGANSN